MATFSSVVPSSFTQGLLPFVFQLSAKASTSPRLKSKNFSAFSFKSTQNVVILPLAEETLSIVWAVLLPLIDHFTNYWLKLRGPMNLAFLVARFVWWLLQFCLIVYSLYHTLFIFSQTNLQFFINQFKSVLLNL